MLAFPRRPHHRPAPIARRAALAAALAAAFAVLLAATVAAPSGATASATFRSSIWEDAFASDTQVLFAARGSTLPTAAVAEDLAEQKHEAEQELIKDALIILDSVHGWWTYEFCHGGQLRQYHPLPPVIERDFPHKKQDYILGTALPPGAASLGEYSVGGQTAKYLSQTWEGGTVCQVGDTGPREVEVRYFCGETAGIPLVHEVASCRYVAVVHVPRLCELPEFVVGGIAGTPRGGVSREGRSERIYCEAVDDGPDLGDDGGDGGDGSGPHVSWMRAADAADPEPASPNALWSWGKGGQVLFVQPVLAPADEPDDANNVGDNGSSVPGTILTLDLDAVDGLVGMPSLVRSIESAFAALLGREPSPDSVGESLEPPRENVGRIDYEALLKKLLEGSAVDRDSSKTKASAGEASPSDQPKRASSVRARVKIVVVDQNGDVLDLKRHALQGVSPNPLSPLEMDGEFPGEAGDEEAGVEVLEELQRLINEAVQREGEG
ncbi:hypothetical protein DFJ73DRAFT_781911 [Zopfochytrium polystomum]|nr:hypothetical protein DFJ73DRAFT_781911 [Zopfochytrium polystomum]